MLRISVGLVVKMGVHSWYWMYVFFVLDVNVYFCVNICLSYLFFLSFSAFITVALLPSRD